jgi:hypothetical protein
VIVEKGPDVGSVPFFGLFMCFWCTFFLETWKRKNATLALEWGMAGFEDAEAYGTVATLAMLPPLPPSVSDPHI